MEEVKRIESPPSWKTWTVVQDDKSFEAVMPFHATHRTPVLHRILHHKTSLGLISPKLNQDWKTKKRKDGYPVWLLRDGKRLSRDLNQMHWKLSTQIGITEKKRKILSTKIATERWQSYQSRTGMMHWKARWLSWKTTPLIESAAQLGYWERWQTNQSRTGLAAEMLSNPVGTTGKRERFCPPIWLREMAIKTVAIWFESTEELDNQIGGRRRRSHPAWLGVNVTQNPGRNLWN